MLLKRIGRKMLVKVRPNPWRKRRIKRFGQQALLDGMRHYCANTTLHGLRYVADPELHAIERFFWLVIFALSAAVASNVIYNFAHRYQEAPTSIGIESTNYKISGIPFPSVTLCPSDRVDWTKTQDVEKRIFSNTTDEATVRTFREILAKMSTITFGDFDELSFLKERDVQGLVDVNITEVLMDVIPSCEKLLTSCWWRNANRNCCEIFEVQKTEYGFCYSFNSEVSVRRENYEVESDEERPRRASGYGDWSGVKVTIHLGNVTDPPDSEEIDGVVIIMSEPRVWPNSGSMIPAGSLVSVALDCVSGFATQPVLELDERRTPCRHMKYDVYNQETCLSLCKREYVYEHCGCNPSFLFPANPHERDCNVSDFFCLIDHNDLFNDYHLLEDSGDHGDAHSYAMFCDCPPECEYYIYDPQFSTVPIYNSQDILLDVHFAGQTGFRYKTDIVITDLNLLVSFGGIIGLFLGGSLLSAAELIYYLMLAMCCYVRSRWQSGSEEVLPMSQDRARVVLPLPILDYGPIKPRSKRIPIFQNYVSANAKANKY